MNDAPPIIEVRGLTKVYYRALGQPVLLKDHVLQWVGGSPRSHAFCALEDVSFSIARGEIVGIMGVNGSGKSTLLRVLSGITSQTRGEAIVRGRVASLLELGVGFSGEMTGRENIFLNGALLGIPRHVLEERMEEIIDFAELREFIDTPVKFYSSGMYLRLGFAIGSHVDPDVLLIDEAFAVGDVGFRQKCKHKLYELVRQEKTILIVSHDNDILHELANRVIILERGRVLADEPTYEGTFLYNRRVRERDIDQTYREPIREDEEEPTFKRRCGTGEVEFTALRVLDRDGRPCEFFAHDDALILEADYVVHQPVRDAKFAVVLYGYTVDLFTASTDGWEIRFDGLAGPGTMRFTIDSLQLLYGSFCFGIVCGPYSFLDRGYKKRWWKYAYDLWIGGAGFVVRDAPDNHGCIGFVRRDCHWEFVQPGTTRAAAGD